MKTFIRFSRLLLLISIVVSTLQAQIPNPGFEDWTAGEPDGWFTSNFPPAIVNVIPTNDSHTGSWAVKGEVLDFMFPLPPFLSTGSQTSDGFSVNQKFNRISGYYKFSPVESDQLLISVYMGIATASDTTMIENGTLVIGDVVTEYTPFSFDIDYIQDDIPNWATIKS